MLWSFSASPVHSKAHLLSTFLEKLTRLTKLFVLSQLIGGKKMQAVTLPLSEESKKEIKIEVEHSILSSCVVEFLQWCKDKLTELRNILLRSSCVTENPEMITIDFGEFWVSAIYIIYFQRFIVFYSSRERNHTLQHTSDNLAKL